MINGILYHVYGRGVNKINIFCDPYDYLFFEKLLIKYLTPNYLETKHIKGMEVQIPVNSVSDLVKLYAYCPMPNHFHLIIENIKDNGIPLLMKRVLPVYVYYFNTKYNRQGPLIQGSYRAIPILSEQQLITTGVYLHINPIKDKLVSHLNFYPYGSYRNYLNNTDTPWLHLNNTLVSKVNFKTLEKDIIFIEKLDASEKVSLGLL